MPNQGLSNPETQGFVPTKFYLIRSTDGENWTEPKQIKEPLIGPSFELCCPIVPLSNGKLFFPTSTWKGWDSYCPNGTKMIAFISDDNGESWDEYIDVMCDSKDKIIYWESRIRELKDGRLLATAWGYDSEQNVDLTNRFAIGTEKGFSCVKSTDLKGQTLDPFVLPNGKILSIYRRTDKPGLWANVSYLNDDEWINEDELFLWGNSGIKLFATETNMVENFNVLRFGAPNTIMVDDKTCFICFWCVEDTVSNIRWIKLEI